MYYWRRLFWKKKRKWCRLVPSQSLISLITFEIGFNLTRFRNIFLCRSRDIVRNSIKRVINFLANRAVKADHCHGRCECPMSMFYNCLYCDSLSLIIMITNERSEWSSYYQSCIGRSDQIALKPLKNRKIWNRFSWSFLDKLNHLKQSTGPTRPWRSLTAYFSESIKDRDVKFWHNLDSSLQFVLLSGLEKGGSLNRGISTESRGG